MTKRPRVVYRDVPQQAGPFTVDRVVGWLAPMALAALVALTGFYYTTNSTVQQQSEQIKQLQKLVSDKTDTDNAQRDKIRESFLASQTKTNEGIAKLDTRLAIAEEQQKVANTQLTKIGDSLERLSNFALGTTTGATGKKH